MGKVNQKILKRLQYETRRNKTTKASVRICNFTIVELMVGMTILSLLMLMMFKFVLSSQRTLDLNDSIWGIYENSRIVFDLIEHDLQSAVASSISGQEIGFYVGNPSLNGNDVANDKDDAIHLCVVSSTEPTDAAMSRLCEINYNHHVDESATSDSKPYVLYRKLTCEDDSTYWDFYGLTTNWHINAIASTNPNGIWNGYQRVVGGVKSFSIKCFDDTDTVITAGTVVTTLPVRIEVNIDLFDPDLVDAPEIVQLKTQKSYTKIFFLSHLED